MKNDRTTRKDAKRTVDSGSYGPGFLTSKFVLYRKIWTIKQMTYLVGWNKKTSLGTRTWKMHTKKRQLIINLCSLTLKVNSRHHDLKCEHHNHRSTTNWTGSIEHFKTKQNWIRYIQSKQWKSHTIYEIVISTRNIHYCYVPELATKSRLENCYHQLK